MRVAMTAVILIASTSVSSYAVAGTPYGNFTILRRRTEPVKKMVSEEFTIQ
jgi:hypothetical protein